MWSLLWSDYTVRTVVLGCGLLGATSGVLGCLAVLRKQSLMGDVLAHATLPGVALAFLLTGTKALPVLWLGAAVTALLASGVMSVRRAVGVDQGTMQAVTLSVFFGLGGMLIGLVNRMPTAEKAGLESLLFGQAAAIRTDHLVAMAGLAVVGLGAMGLYWKEIKAVCFDPVFAGSTGAGERRLGVLLAALLLAAILMGLQAVGVILTSALLVAPCVAARCWSRHMAGLVVGAAGIGAGCGIAGAWLSAVAYRLPTGPVVVVLLAAVTVVSLLFGRETGVVVRRVRQRRSDWARLPS